MTNTQRTQRTNNNVIVEDSFESEIAAYYNAVELDELCVNLGKVDTVH